MRYKVVFNKKRPYRWTVVHKKTGKAIGSFDEQKSAEARAYKADKEDHARENQEDSQEMHKVSEDASRGDQMQGVPKARMVNYNEDRLRESVSEAMIIFKRPGKQEETVRFEKQPAYSGSLCEGGARAIWFNHHDEAVSVGYWRNSYHQSIGDVVTAISGYGGRIITLRV